MENNDGERWKTTDITIVNDLLTRIVEHAKNKYGEYVDKYKTNKNIKNKLEITKKYIDRCDFERITELENEEGNNIDEIKICKDFYDMVYRDIINMLHDYKDIIVQNNKN